MKGWAAGHSRSLLGAGSRPEPASAASHSGHSAAARLRRKIVSSSRGLGSQRAGPRRARPAVAAMG
eukprot:1181931-Prorocentrum_minimum.AAC.4